MWRKIKIIFLSNDGHEHVVKDNPPALQMQTLFDSNKTRDNFLVKLKYLIYTGVPQGSWLRPFFF